MKKKARIMLFLCLLALSLCAPAFAAQAATSTSTGSTTTTKVKAGWVLKDDGYYYWQKSNGKFVTSKGFKTLGGKVYYLGAKGRRKTGLLTIKGKKYYLNPSLTYGLKTVNGNKYYFDPETGAAVTSQFVTVKNKTYYFDSSGCMVKNKWVKYNGHYYYLKKSGVRAAAGSWLTLSTGTYYISKKGYRVTGLKTISKKKYYFLSNGILVTDKTAYKINGTWYTISAKGVAKKANTSNTKVACSIKTQAFIETASTKFGLSSSATNAQKFKACFRYIIAYTRFTGYDPLTSTEVSSGTWPYSRALSMLNSNLTGNCYGIASLVASCAKELGYEPYVVAITAGHAFVMIDGKYYDNMGGSLFGASKPAIYPYTVRSKIKF